MNIPRCCPCNLVNLRLKTRGERLHVSGVIVGISLAFASDLRGLVNSFSFCLSCGALEWR